MQGTWHDSRPGSECFTTSSDQSPFFPCKCSGSIQEAFSHQGSITFGLALCGKQVIQEHHKSLLIINGPFCGMNLGKGKQGKI